MHFYAGVFIAPFLLIAAATGLLYAFTPQIDDVVYHHDLHVSAAGRSALPLSRQVRAARTAHPGGDLAEIVPAAGRGDTTRVSFTEPHLGDDQRTVFIDPYTATVRGTLRTWFNDTPTTTWIDALHRNLHLGALGRNYSETAASWLWVLVLGGLTLWLQRLRHPGRDRRNLLRRAATQDLRSKGVRRTRGWHAATGVWLAVGLLFLSATGLTWSRYAGGHFGAALTAMHASSPDLRTALPAPTARPAGTGPNDPAGVGSVDQYMATAAAVGLTHDVTLTPPADPGSAWTVAEVDRTWPVHFDQIAIDPGTGKVTATDRYGDWPMLAKLSKLGIQAHMGYLFGLVNQVLLAALATGLICVIVWGYRMWWQRRPTGTRFDAGAVPRRGAWRSVPRAQLALAALIAVAICWALPVLGVTLMGFVVLDAILSRILRQRGRRSGTALTADVAGAAAPASVR